MSPRAPTISMAFRFHVNFYHSYRGDALDDTGIGPDIRIIRSILDALDRLNDEGIPVCGTWDIENYYSLELYIPKYAPDILERIQARVAAGRDEVELMSYNNGIVSAHTEEEFNRAIGWAITNPAGSGLADLFSEHAPIVRPQECMLTPSQIAGYARHGVEAVSLYYSALPFNGFSTFVPPLSTRERYNPLTLRGPDGASIALLPAYNHGDIADHLPGLRHWVKSLRRKQLRGFPNDASAPAAPSPDDLLLLIDMDADDEFWEGINIPLLPRLFPSFNGLTNLVRQVADLEYVRFVRPYDYLRAHEPAGEITIGQDTADGSFDGYSSWAEKRENHEVWSVIDRARWLSEAVQSARGDEPRPAVPETLAAPTPPGVDAPTAVNDALDRSLTARLLAMSTTHFGLASPVMNADRLNDARASAAAALESADQAWRSSGAGNIGSARVYFNTGIDRLAPGFGAPVTIHAVHRKPLPRFINPARSEIDYTTEYLAARRPAPPAGRDAPKAAEEMKLAVDAGGSALLSASGEAVMAPLRGPWVRYAGRTCFSASIRVEADASGERVRRWGWIRLPGQHATWGRRITWHDTLRVIPGVPYLFVDLQVTLPQTEATGYDRAKAVRLAREWDARWQEIAPAELIPVIGSTLSSPASVWKHNFEDKVSSYTIDYHRFSRNRELDSSNNQITNGWIAVAGRNRGLLVAYNRAVNASFAFCPIRTRIRRSRQEIRLNPFGTYAGRQWRYPTAATGLGRSMALHMADQLDSYAPSYAGSTLSLSLMVAPYRIASDTGEPPEGIQRDALLFGTPGVVLGSLRSPT